MNYPRNVDICTGCGNAVPECACTDGLDLLTKEILIPKLSRAVDEALREVQKNLNVDYLSREDSFAILEAASESLGFVLAQNLAATVNMQLRFKVKDSARLTALLRVQLGASVDQLAQTLRDYVSGTLPLPEYVEVGSIGVKGVA